MVLRDIYSFIYALTLFLAQHRVAFSVCGSNFFFEKNKWLFVVCLSFGILESSFFINCNILRLYFRAHLYRSCIPTISRHMNNSINSAYHDVLRSHGHERAETEARFNRSLLEPAGQENSKVTVNGDFDEYSAFENPAYANKTGRKTNYSHSSHNDSALGLSVGGRGDSNGIGR